MVPCWLPWLVQCTLMLPNCEGSHSVRLYQSQKLDTVLMIQCLLCSFTNIQPPFNYTNVRRCGKGGVYRVFNPTRAVCTVCLTLRGLPKIYRSDRNENKKKHMQISFCKMQLSDTYQSTNAYTSLRISGRCRKQSILTGSVWWEARAEGEITEGYVDRSSTGNQEHGDDQD